MNCGERPQALLDPDGDCALDQEIMNFFMYDRHRHWADDFSKT